MPTQTTKFCGPGWTSNPDPSDAKEQGQDAWCDPLSLGGEWCCDWNGDWDGREVHHDGEWNPENEAGVDPWKDFLQPDWSAWGFAHAPSDDALLDDSQDHANHEGELDDSSPNLAHVDGDPCTLSFYYQNVVDYNSVDNNKGFPVGSLGTEEDLQVAFQSFCIRNCDLSKPF